MKRLIALAATLAMLLVAAAPAMASTHPTMVHTDSVMIMTGGGDTMVDLDAPHHHMMM